MRGTGRRAAGNRRAGPRRRQPLSRRVLRRAEAADRDRAGAGAAAEDPCARRAGLGARRVDSGGHHQPAAGSAGAIRIVLSVCVARSFGGQAPGPPGGGDVPGNDRRAGRRRPGVHQSAARVHPAVCWPPFRERTLMSPVVNIVAVTHPPIVRRLAQLALVLVLWLVAVTGCSNGYRDAPAGAGRAGRHHQRHQPAGSGDAARRRQPAARAGVVPGQLQRVEHRRQHGGQRRSIVTPTLPGRLSPRPTGP